MKIKVSKVFAKFITETAKENGAKFDAVVVEFSPAAYGLHVGDIYEACANGDYSDETGRGRAIMIRYDWDCYACPRYLSTGELVREFWRRQVRDVNGLKNMILDLLCI